MTARILYIEDNEQNYYLVHFILTTRGHEVSWARDGKTGIEAATASLPDLVLLDIQLPVMDGYAVAKALRGSPELRGTPIVALTSYAMPGDRDKALAAGCSGYLEKPINPSLFLGQIESHLMAATSHKTEGP
jgi:CheY-like chemotaxis protein